jgi:pyruvate/2-oxoglutarate dehydrogenase complex dihydrolipoamide dehydrogenase (E3) component
VSQLGGNYRQREGIVVANEILKYDAIVIGSGQGGNPLAGQLAARGEKVAIIESHLLGGTCINTGCTPTKTMVASAQVAHYARMAERWGVRAGEVSVDLPAVLKRKKEVVEEFRSGWSKKFEGKVDVYRERARFTGPKQIAAGERKLEGARIFIDTGSAPTIPPIEGLHGVPYLTNVSLLELDELPEHLLVLGGGYVGLEFGQMFRRFESAVTVVQSAARILSSEDDDITAELQKSLEAEGVKFLLNRRATKVTRDGKQIRLTVKGEGGEEAITGSHLLIAVGRTPQTKDLDLEKAGVKTDQKGYIVVNERLETTATDIWALGDVTGGPAFTHISYNDYQIIYGNLYEGKGLSTKTRLVPYAIYTDPALGRVGLTEKAARATGRKLKIGKVPMSNVARAIERSETAGLMKLVVDADRDHILGAAILAAEGGETVQILSTLMLAERPYTLLKGAIYIHPTLAEGFFGLMDSVK